MKDSGAGVAEIVMGVSYRGQGVQEVKGEE